MIELLDCNGTVDTPICGYVININDTVANFSLNLEQINNTLLAMNASMIQRFDAVIANLSQINNTLYYAINDTQTLIQSLVNCTSSPGSDICSYLSSINVTVESTLSAVTDLNNTLLNVNTTLWDFYLYFNNTIWGGNLTAQDLLNAINSITINTSTLSSVITEIDSLKDFQEELIFLVTDSLVLEREAKNSFENGDIQTASSKLKEANDNLREVTDRLVQREKELRTSSTSVVVPSVSVGWWLPAIIVVVIVALGAYLFSRPPEQPYRRY